MVKQHPVRCYEPLDLISFRMVDRIRPLQFLLLLLPTEAFAHGEEMLETAFLQGASLVLFLLVVLFIRLPYAKRALLVTVYLLMTGLVWGLMAQLPYQANHRMINLLIGVVPIVGVIAAYGFSTWLPRKQKP